MRHNLSARLLMVVATVAVGVLCAGHAVADLITAHAESASGDAYNTPGVPECHSSAVEAYYNAQGYGYTLTTYAWADAPTTYSVAGLWRSSLSVSSSASGYISYSVLDDAFSTTSAFYLVASGGPIILPWSVVDHVTMASSQSGGNINASLSVYDPGNPVAPIAQGFYQYGYTPGTGWVTVGSTSPVLVNSQPVGKSLEVVLGVSGVAGVIAVPGPSGSGTSQADCATR